MVPARYLHAMLLVHLVPVLQLADPRAVAEQLAGGAPLELAHVTLPAVERAVDAHVADIVGHVRWTKPTGAPTARSTAGSAT